MTIATLSSAVFAPINGASVRRLFAGWSRLGMRARVRAHARIIQASGVYGAVPVSSPASPSVRKWPFPPVQPAVPVPQAHSPADCRVPQAAAQADAKRAVADAGLGDVRHLSTVQALGVRRMVVDVLLVAMWGALIPGLMWLGAAAGF